VIQISTITLMMCLDMSSHKWKSECLSSLDNWVSNDL